MIFVFHVNYVYYICVWRLPLAEAQNRLRAANSRWSRRRCGDALFRELSSAFGSFRSLLRRPPKSNGRHKVCHFELSTSVTTFSFLRFSHSATFLRCPRAPAICSSTTIPKYIRIDSDGFFIIYFSWASDPLEVNAYNWIQANAISTYWWLRTLNRFVCQTYLRFIFV